MERLLSAVFWAAKGREPQAVTAWRRAGRAVFVARLRLQAAWHRVELDLDLAPDLRVGRGVRVTLQPGSRCTLAIGPETRLAARVLIHLKGGSVRLGPRCELRRDTVLNVAGELVFERENILSWGVVVHCNRSVVLHPMASVAEHVTIADSSHFVDDPDEHFYHNVREGRVEIGRNTWICANATVVRNAVIGDYCIVTAGSVVADRVPDGHAATGVPATHRPLRLPFAVDPPVAVVE